MGVCDPNTARSARGYLTYWVADRAYCRDPPDKTSVGRWIMCNQVYGFNASRHEPQRLTPGEHPSLERAQRHTVFVGVARPLIMRPSDSFACRSLQMANLRED